MNIKLRYCLEIDEKKCTGCQACVLACSYHRSKTFSIENISCIEVFRNNKNGDIKINLDQCCCDMCEQEEMPLCIQFCASEAIKIVKTI
jgi:carbon-monoxide dehydrogenase iron sulfur subunit